MTDDELSIFENLEKSVGQLRFGVPKYWSQKNIWRNGGGWLLVFRCTIGGEPCGTLEISPEAFIGVGSHVEGERDFVLETGTTIISSSIESRRGSTFIRRGAQIVNSSIFNVNGGLIDIQDDALVRSSSVQLFDDVKLEMQKKSEIANSSFNLSACEAYGTFDMVLTPHTKLQNFTKQKVSEPRYFCIIWPWLFGSHQVEFDSPATPLDFSGVKPKCMRTNASGTIRSVQDWQDLDCQREFP